MTIIAGARSPSQIVKAVKNGWFQMQKVSWVISPITMIVAQNFLPPHTWVPFFNLVAFGIVSSS
jgi:peroxisomal membrane protein 2